MYKCTIFLWCTNAMGFKRCGLRSPARLQFLDQSIGQIGNRAGERLECRPIQLPHQRVLPVAPCSGRKYTTINSRQNCRISDAKKIGQSRNRLGFLLWPNRLTTRRSRRPSCLHRIPRRQPIQSIQRRAQSPIRPQVRLDRSHLARTFRPDRWNCSRHSF